MKLQLSDEALEIYNSIHHGLKARALEKAILLLAEDEALRDVAFIDSGSVQRVLNSTKVVKEVSEVTDGSKIDLKESVSMVQEKKVSWGARDE